MQLISKFNKRFRFLLCVADVFSKYTWVIPLKDKKDITIANAFKKIIDKSNPKPNKIWVNKGRILQQVNGVMVRKIVIEIYSVTNKGKSVVAERFIGTLKKKKLKIHDFNIEKCLY